MEKELDIDKLRAFSDECVRDHGVVLTADLLRFLKDNYGGEVPSQEMARGLRKLGFTLAWVKR